MPWFVEAWSLKLFTININPGAEALPVIAHDLELQADGQQLAWVSVTYFYCEFFHLAAFFISFMSSLTSRRISSIASAILFSCFFSMLYLFLMYPT